MDRITDSTRQRATGKRRRLHAKSTISPVHAAARVVSDRGVRCHVNNGRDRASHVSLGPFFGMYERFYFMKQGFVDGWAKLIVAFLCTVVLFLLLRPKVSIQLDSLAHCLNSFPVQ